MNFNHRCFDSCDGVSQGDGGVSVSAGIDDDALVGEACLVNPVDQGTLGVALKIMENDTGVFLLEGFKILLERALAVNVRLTGTEQIEIWAVDDENFHFE